jgi:antitoxin (DNA-binding transcriptional repressor) of toxin-antitoxin stability system
VWLAGIGSPTSRVDGDDPLVYTVRDLNQRTASIISEIEMAGKPAFITRHGRFVAMITPLASGQVESRVLAEMAREIGEPTPTDLQLLGTDKRQAPGRSSPDLPLAHQRQTVHSSLL